jgi:PadR family transcriptional regulator PadR
LSTKVYFDIIPMSHMGGTVFMAGSDLYTGTLDVLILTALATRPLHGYAIGLWIRNKSERVLDIREGVLYPALHRLEQRGWLTSKWGTTDTKRRAKFYRLTAGGRKQLHAEIARLTEHSEAVLSVLRALG